MNSFVLADALKKPAPDGEGDIAALEQRAPAAPRIRPPAPEQPKEASLEVRGDGAALRDEKVDLDQLRLQTRRARKPAADAPVEPAQSASRSAHAQVRAAVQADRSFLVVMVSTALSIGVAFAIGRSGWFTPGDNIGYYVGLAGGVMMLLLLLYPLRKHVAALRNWGKVKYWFAVHMILGIAGPILVLAHSTFHMRSTNAAVAQVCMLVVAGSGIIGRFLYTKVHRGLYGEKLNLKELESQIGVESAEIRSRLHFAPKVEERLIAYQALAQQPASGVLGVTARFLRLVVRRIRTQRACLRDLREALARAATDRGWDDAKHQRRTRAANSLVEEYLRASQRVAEFSMYDRMLQLWHIAHVPLVYLLVISAIAHVVSVHMY